ncbi:MAG: potassium transporter TrkG [Draconibacterium sp.]
MRLRTNYVIILHFISIVMVFESLLILLPIIVSLIYREGIALELLASSVTILIPGLLLNIITRRFRNIEPRRKESIIIVSIGWFILGLFGTFPYLFTGAIPNFTNAFFESISGFTTTGSSILADIEALPKSVLFWRAETHWIGGMGIIVLVVAIMPFLNITGMYLYQSETSSAAEERVAVRIRYVARNLWLVYIGFTFAEIILLTLGKMSLFDSICHSFATVATGGFSTKNDSVAGYSPYVQYVVMLFMLLSGINFAVHLTMLKKDYRKALKNEELRTYLSIIFVAGMVITFILYANNSITFERAFRDSFFQVVSIITATGFATADYLVWPIQAILLIAVLMLIGASAGSTGGGIKVIRHLIAFKKVKQSIKSIIYPNSVISIQYNGNGVEQKHTSTIMGFIFVYLVILLVSVLILMVTGLDAPSSFGAAATCMAGIGPGFGTVGPVSNFLNIPEVSKYFLTFLMVLGRLELFSILVLFTRTFWRS